MHLHDEVSRSSSTSRLELVTSSQIVKTSARQRTDTSRLEPISVSRTKVQKQPPVMLMNPAVYDEYLKDDLGSRMERSEIPGCDFGSLRYRLVEDLGRHLMLFARSVDSLKTVDYSLCEPFVLAVISPTEFLDAITATDSDSCVFPALERAVERIFSSTEGPIEARRVLCVVGLDKQCLAHQKKLAREGRSGVSVVDLVDSATAFLQYQLDVEVVCFKRKSDFCEYTEALVDRIAARVRADQVVVTEIDCVHKVSREAVPEGLSGRAAEVFELRQCWSAMLQTVPKMSRDKATALMTSAECTCPLKLRRLFQDDPAVTDPATATDAAAARRAEAERKLRLQSHFGRTKSGKPTKQGKLSRHLYGLVNSVDPLASLSDG